MDAPPLTPFLSIPQLPKSCSQRLAGQLIAFTTPSIYASRLQYLLQQNGAIPLWCPSVVVETTPHSRQAVLHCLSGSSRLAHYSGIAFTSRSGIKALAEALQGCQQVLDPVGDEFFVCALGRDAELIKELNLFGGNKRVTMVVPSISTPDALVEKLGQGNGRHILCPVPSVENLEEPRVIPDFLQALLSKGWQAERLNAYVTRWAGFDCAKDLLGSSASEASSMALQEPCMKNVDALVFTSTAEVEGLLKSLNALGIPALRRGSKPVIAAHGPVTAAGASRLGLQVDVVNKTFHGFEGIIDSLDLYWKSVTT